MQLFLWKKINKAKFQKNQFCCIKIILLKNFIQKQQIKLILKHFAHVCVY